MSGSPLCLPTEPDRTGRTGQDRAGQSRRAYLSPHLEPAQNMPSRGTADGWTRPSISGRVGFAGVLPFIPDDTDWASEFTGAARRSWRGLDRVAADLARISAVATPPHGVISRHGRGNSVSAGQ